MKWLWLLALPCAAYAEVPALNGDFESDLAAMPPPGWVMWGAEQYKVPRNYTSDPANAHSGRAAFRIDHPAGTAGYVVSDPQRAIRPLKNHVYTVSFWAKSDVPGPAVFGFTAYASIQPFIDAPSPGFFTFEPTTEWQRFEFSVREGLDFLASRCPYILLTLNATRDSTVRRTLWVDDLVVTQSPDPHPVNLVDERALIYPPFQHRLTPGEQLSLWVDVNARAHRTCRELAGVSFHRVCGWTGHPYNRQGAYTLQPELEQALRDMHLPMTRFYAVGDEPFGVEASIDRAAEVLDRVGIPQSTTVLEFETQGATTSIPPEDWVKGVRHSLDKGYGFRMWEVGNEPYAAVWGVKTAFPTADDYIRHFLEVSDAIRAAHPTGQIGIGIAPDNLRWGNYVLQQAAGHYDFVVAHWYAARNIHRRSFEDIALTDNFQTLDRIQRLNALIKAYNPGRDVYQYDTEWGAHSSGPNGERADYVDRNGNIYGTIHRAVRLICYLREDLLRGASSWQMFSDPGGQGFGVLFPKQPAARSLIYWLYYLLNRHTGDWVLETKGTAPWYQPPKTEDPAGTLSGPLTPAVAMASEDGRTVFVVAANGSWSRSVPAKVTLSGFRPVEATATCLSADDPDGKPLVTRRDDVVRSLPCTIAGSEVTWTCPAHSVVFLQIK